MKKISNKNCKNAKFWNEDFKSYYNSNTHFKGLKDQRVSMAIRAVDQAIKDLDVALDACMQGDDPDGAMGMAHAIDDLTAMKSMLTETLF